MINYLRHIAVFARVADKGSFRAVAQELGLAPSRISQTVTDLETYLGVSLFHRTTRQLSLTHEGKNFYIHAAKMVGNAETGLNELNALSEKPRGELKISLPAFLASSPISLAIADFANKYPEISLSLFYTDHVVDIIKEGLDLAIRVTAGSLKDSSMMSRKLVEIKRLLIASKHYTETQTIPKHPDDLKNWDWIRFQMRPNITELFSPSGEIATITENQRISVNSAVALQYFAKKSVGITILPENLIADEITLGEFVHILPEWELKPLKCYAVWPSKSRIENLAMLLVRFLAERDLSV